MTVEPIQSQRRTSLSCKSQRLNPAEACHKAFKHKALCLAVSAVVYANLLNSYPAFGFELPVPAPVLVAPGNGSVLPPEISGNTMTIHQLSNKATLDWQSFNIGPENTVRFDQPQVTSVALNRIHQADPSQILGQLTANGQVYLVNQNGFVFGPNSQVNANTLLVSTLDVTDDAMQKGLTKVVDSSPSLGPIAALSGDGSVYRTNAQGQVEKIAIKVEAGAKLSSNAAYGRVLLAAPSIENRGDIQSPDGQVILAAATDKVYLQEADPGSDLRGILVEVKTGGDIHNLGRVLAERGNATLIGFALRQEGEVSASTSVALNGSVRLLAREGAQLSKQANGTYRLLPTTSTRGADLGDGLGSQATVTLGSGSRTAIDLDNSGGTAVNEQTQPRSRIDLEAGKILLQTGSLVQAKNGTVNLTASEHPDNPLALGTSAANGSRIVLESGSKIDVSGTTDTVLPMSRNVVSLDLRSYELRDASIQKTGPLYGQTVQVDSRAADANGHIPIADISGAIAKIQRSVSERNTQGGTVNLASEGSIILNPSAQIDISGGVIHYLGGLINTTKLVDSEGRIYDIATANPLHRYTQIFGKFSKVWKAWGITESWDLPGPLHQGVYEQGYDAGQNAGTVNITGREVMMEAEILSKTIDGIYQRASEQRASGGKVSIDTAWSGERQQAVQFRANQALASLDDHSAFPRDTQTGEPAPLVLSNQIFDQGLRNLSINSMGAIRIDKDATLNLPADGSLQLKGGEIDVQGSINAPSGDVSLSTHLVSGNSPALSGTIQLGEHSHLDVSGVWVSDLNTQGNSPLTPITPIDGGSVSLIALGDLLLPEGSSIKANGGGWMGIGHNLAQGIGGTINLVTAGVNTPTRIQLGADLQAYALQQGGSLSITANAVRIGQQTHTEPDTLLQISPDLLENQGFSQINLSANAGNLELAPGITINLKALNYQPKTALTAQGAGIQFDPNPALGLLPDTQRQAVNLNLNLIQNSNVTGYAPAASLTLGAGSAILGDLSAQVNLRSDANIHIDGTVNAPSGAISATVLAPNFPVAPDYNPNQVIALGSQARLAVSGETLANPNRQGINLGDVTGAGSVNLTANRGYVLMDKAAVIDVSGTADSLDSFIKSGPTIGEFQAQTIAAAAGSLSIRAAEGIVLEGSLLGQAGGPKAVGGSLSLELNTQFRAEPRYDSGENAGKISVNFPVNPRIIHLSETGSEQLPEDWYTQGTVSTSLNGQAYLSSQQVAQSGFSGITLNTAVIMPATLGQFIDGPEQGSIQLDGPLNFHTDRYLVLDTPLLNWNGNAGNAVLSSAYLSLGSSLNRTTYALGSLGAGQVSLQADWIDLKGALETQNIALTRLQSRQDIRLIGINPNQEKDLLGAWASAGDLTLTARQIYPSSLSQFSLSLDANLNPNGTIHISPGDSNATTPLSAASRLTLSAPNIETQGVLRAPLGQIALVAGQSLRLQAGSLTSTSAGSSLIPLGRTQGGLDWVYPLGAYTNIFNEPAQQGISLQGPDIQFGAGARIELSGGGDLTAFEFIPGPGGSVDQLNPKDSGYASNSVTYQPSYAVIPGLGSAFAPYDPLEIANACNCTGVGSSIYLSGGNGLAAGNYTLLPAHYALLPGAYLITPTAGTQDLQAGHTMLRMDGTPIVSGYRYASGTQEADSHWSGFAVEPGSMARTRSEYQETTANRFYPQRAADKDSPVPLLPKDAGSLFVSASQSLGLAGVLQASGVDGGRGGRLDISASNLRIVSQGHGSGSEEAGTVVLSATELNHLQVESLLLGGKRTLSNGNLSIQTDTLTLTLAEGASLVGPELILTAQNDLNLATGSSLTAQGTVSGVSSQWQMQGQSALLRVSSASQIDLTRTASSSNSAGRFSFAPGALLKSNGSILLDATGGIDWQGELQLNQGALSLAASRISLGLVPAGTGGLSLNNGQLRNINALDLRLISASGMDLYGDLDFTAQNLSLHTASLQGFGSAGQTARLRAKSLLLDNAQGVSDSPSSNGSGNLALDSDRITLGKGNYAITGFNQISLNARDALLVQGTGNLQTGGDLLLAAGKISAMAGANSVIDAGNHNVSTSRDPTGHPDADPSGLGARLEIRGRDIVHSGWIDLPSGIVSLKANGNLSLADGSLINTSGKTVVLGGLKFYAPAGVINLSADLGDLVLAETAQLAVSGSSSGGNAGAINLSALAGEARLNGQISGKAQSGFAGGSFSLEAMTLSGTDFSGLNRKLQQGGFEQSLAIRLKTGNLTIAQTEQILAHELVLTLDSGSLTLQGLINASGPQGGQVTLAAGDGLLIDNTAQILAYATGAGEEGGSISLQSVDVDQDGLAGVTLQTGARLDVSAGAGGAGGTVAVRVDRLGSDDAAINLATGTVTGAAKQTVEAVKTLLDPSLSNAQILQWQNETNSYITAALVNGALQTRLGGFELLPGLAVQSSADLTLNLTENLKTRIWTKVTQGTNTFYYTQMDDLAGVVSLIQQTSSTGTVRTLTAAINGTLSTDGTYYYDTDPNSATFRRLTLRVFPDTSLPAANRYDPSKIRDSLAESNGWDFFFPAKSGVDWRYGAAQTPGILTLQAAGNLTLKQNLSDGFALLNASQLGEMFGVTPSNWLSTWILQTGESWSYRLTAGADLTSANPLSTKANAQSLALTLGSNTAIRTGTGDIALASSGDIKLTDQTSAIYTAGKPTNSNRYGTIPVEDVILNFNAEYPIDGGSISLAAGRDIIGAASSQFMSDWLIRTGNYDPANGTEEDRPTAWGILFDSIVGQNSANSRIQNLRFGFQENVGALAGGNVKVKANRNIQDLSLMLPTTAKPIGAAGSNVWDLQGGGDLTVQAGGDIKGGVFFVDRGVGEIKAGGTITGGSQYVSGPVFGVGDGQFYVSALGDLNVGAVVNPYVVTQAKFTDKPAYFTTYTDASLLNLTALAGNLHFNNDLETIRKNYKIFDAQSPKGRVILNSFDLPLLGIYPGSLQAYAYNGAIDFARSFSLYPSAQGALEWVAAGNISNAATSPIKINQSDLDISTILNPALPNQSLNLPANSTVINWLNGSDAIPARLHAATPVHAQDSAPVLMISDQGSLKAGAGLQLITAKPLYAYAGVDIVGFGLGLQNVQSGAVSTLLAGRDILYPIQRDPTTGDVLGSSQSLLLSGPGQLRLLAGRNLDLGSSDGIRSVGNLINPSLSGEGADLLILAGLGSPSQFLDLAQAEVDGLFLQLRLSGIAAAKAKDENDPAKQAAAYKAGYAAIDRLFPGSGYAGDIKLFFSTIQTVDGGNIQMLAPGGLINVGLPTAFTGSKSADQLGIVAQQQGDISIFVYGDLLVNRSRVSTLDGGDILVWSSYGNIDAGRGAKSALSAPLPIVSFDSQGNLVVTFPPTVSGSGIRAQSGTGKGKKGDPILIAPNGFVDAGEAGIEGNNVVIAANAVVNAGNIQVQGATSGVPQAVTVAPLPASIGNSLAAATDAAQSILQAQDPSPQSFQQPLKTTPITSTLTAQVVGFGECSISDVRAGKPGCGE